MTPEAVLATVPEWQYADLRALDPTDAPIPGQDLVALSMRHDQGQVQIRLDWLDIGPESECDVRIDFYTGNNHPVLAESIRLTTDGDVKAYPALRGLRVFWDYFYDTVTLSFSADSGWLRAPYSIQIQTINPRNQDIADRIGPVRSDGAPPPTIPILLAFWNTFTAVTPAQALRQWDGAHSGPQRDRHGLRHLLEASAQTYTPIILLDLKTPAALSALDMVGGMDLLRRLNAAGLAVLPDTASFNETVPEWAIQRTLAESREVGLDFGLGGGAFFYTGKARANASQGALTGFHIQESLEPMVMQCIQERIIPLSGSLRPDSSTYADQASRDGPSLALRKILANAHTSSGYTQIGGDFAVSSWGTPQAVQATLRYLAARPWLNMLDASELLELQPTQTCPPITTQPVAPLIETILAEFEKTPDNAMKETAWQVFQAMQVPATAELVNLRTGYMGQIGHWLSAARWSELPHPNADCSQDLDWDGESECVLSSETFFALLEKNGGYISVAAAILDGEVHQVITPSWQFTVGLSDPMDWKPERGIAGDPAALPGAFFDPADKWRNYESAVAASEVIFRDPAGSKIFQIAGNQLVVTYGGNTGAQQVVVLGLDTWVRFRPGWARNYSEISPNQDWTWSLAQGPQVRLDVGEASLMSDVFNTSLSFLDTPEDPNFAYPPGHFLPFPLALVTIEEATIIELTVTQSPAPGQ